MRTRRRWMAWPSLVLIFGTAGEVAACPNCKEALANQEGGEAQRLADGYSYSILVMMAMPFTLLGTGAYFVARAVRQGQLPEI